MKDAINVLQQVVPDIVSLLNNRYHILQQIQADAPVGRRTLSEKLHLSERNLRTETTFLRHQGLITSSPMGMTLTTKGQRVLRELEDFVGSLFQMNEKEQALADTLHLQLCKIVPGDVDEDPGTLGRLGEEAVKAVDALLPDGDFIVATAGGSTMAEVAAHMTPDLAQGRKFIFVPTRGGLGESMMIQANSVSDRMALATGGENLALFVPDNLSEKAYQSLKSEPSIRQTLDVMKKANCLLYSIGNAKVMIERRRMPSKEKNFLKEYRAVGEAFGCYFDEEGTIVYRLSRFGLQIEDIERIPYAIAIAGGNSKAKAIKAYSHIAPEHTWLITDEGAANLILKGDTL